MSTTIDRTNYNLLVDDTGGAIPDGSNWNKNDVKIVCLDPIDAMIAGAMVFGSTVEVTGVLTVDGFGVHTFNGGAGSNSNNSIKLQNANGGNAASTSILMDNDVRVSNLTLRSTGSGMADSYFAAGDGALFRGNGVGGVAISAQHASGKIIFYTGGVNERMSIDENGKILVNTTSIGGAPTVGIAYSGAAANGISLNDTASQSGVGFMSFRAGNVEIGGITRNLATSAVLYNTTSDRRLKRDFGLAKNLDRLQALRVHDFAWKVDDTLDRGIFAQEAYEHYPLAITPGDEEPAGKPWQADYSKFVPDLIVGWQQHERRIAELKSQIESLQHRLSGM